MACCYHEECGEYAVTPALVAPSCRRNAKCCEDACYPCLPRCIKSPRPKTPPRTPVDDSCQHQYHYRESSPQPRRPRSPPPTRQSSATGSHCCPTCSHPTCKPVKTKYVIPCYRYEDGRIERYVPTQHGRLPMSAYRRNGMQDQIYGYRGAIRVLCAGESRVGPIVHTAVEPLRRLYPKITQEMLPIKKKKDKK